MAEVEWIKVSTSMFETSRKIKSIELMKDGDRILVIWFKLLLLAGNVNDGGAIYITEDKPYDLESLAGELRRPEALVKKALEVFEGYGMIERENGIIYLTSWEKYQSSEKLEIIKEQNRIRQANFKKRKKALSSETDNVSGNVTSNATGNAEVTLGNAVEERRENKEFHSFTPSGACACVCAGEDEAVENLQKGALMRRYLGGTLGGGVVLLSEAQFDSLCEKLSLEELERYLAVVRDCEKKGMRYKKSHYQAILDMANEDRKV